MIEDLKWLFNIIVKSFQIRKKTYRRSVFSNKNHLIDIRIQIRRVAFTVFLNIFFILLILPLTFDIHYPDKRYLWKWEYLICYAIFTLFLYFVTVYVTPRLRRAKFVYLLRGILILPASSFWLIFGIQLGMNVIPINLYLWFFIFLSLVISFSPIIYYKKFLFLDSEIEKRGARILINNNNPFWDHKVFLVNESNFGANKKYIGLYMIIVSLTMGLLINANHFFSANLTNLLRFSIITSFILYITVEVLIRNFCIFKIISSIELDINQKVFLKTHKE